MSSRRSILHLGERGFSLTELMVGLVVAGIIAIVAIPNFNKANKDQQLRSAASQIESSLRRARSQAVSRNIDVRVSVNPVTMTITRQADTDGDGTFETQSESADLPHGIALANVSFGGGNTVIFNGRGRPDNAGSLAIIASHGYQRTLTLAAGSGAVSISHQEPLTESQATQ